MIVTKELSNAAVEINSLLDNVSEEVLNKIPKKFIEYLKDIESYDYYFEYDTSKTIDEQNFSDEALKLIGLIYKDYLCTENEREDYNKILNEYNFKLEEEKREKYNPETIFDNRKKENKERNILLIEYKESLFTKIINKIKSFLNKWR